MLTDALPSTASVSITIPSRLLVSPYEELKCSIALSFLLLLKATSSFSAFIIKPLPGIFKSNTSSSSPDIESV